MRRKRRLMLIAKRTAKRQAEITNAVVKLRR